MCSHLQAILCLQHVVLGWGLWPLQHTSPQRPERSHSKDVMDDLFVIGAAVINTHLLHSPAQGYRQTGDDEVPLRYIALG